MQPARSMILRVAVLGLALGLCDCGAEVTVPQPVDAAVVVDLAVVCAPACAAGAPFCNAAHHCVVCLTDHDCPLGSICTPNGLDARCAPGCHSDDRCPPSAGGGREACCGGACLDVGSNRSNCGGCGVICTLPNSTTTCKGGLCAVSHCDPGFVDCNANPTDGCEVAVHVDPNNCGACQVTCSYSHGLSGCADGCYLAGCQGGYDDCDGSDVNGCETATDSDARNCGGCGVTCPNPAHAAGTCATSKCGLLCNNLWGDCNLMANDGCERALDTDVNNCGACGNVCAQGLICKSGGCTCPQCNIPNASSKCVNNQCTFDKCNPGFGDCDNNQNNGCEVNLNSDANNCGGCAMACPMNKPVCAGGVCNNLFCHDVGYANCPTGQKQFCVANPINAGDQSQALAACLACFANNCNPTGGDCAGLGDCNGNVCWGWQGGCSGASGRVWQYGNSYTTYGRWAP